jgi:hypothetical protein
MEKLPWLAGPAYAQYQIPQYNPCAQVYGGNQGLVGMALNAIQQQQRMQDCQKYRKRRVAGTLHWAGGVG